MNRPTAMLTVALGALALPASSLAASSTGTVLSVDRSHHRVQVVDSEHLVHAYHFGHIAQVARGSRIRFTAAGNGINVLSNLGESSTVSFYAKVVRSRAGALVLRLGDGDNITIAGRQLSRARAAARTSTQGAPVLINVDALRPGETVLVTEAADPRTGSTITIELTGTSGGGTVSEHQVDGVVAAVQGNTLGVMTTRGAALKLSLSQDVLAKVRIIACDKVAVSYHRDAGTLVVDSVLVSGKSTSGACAGHFLIGSHDAVGAIATVSGARVAIVQAGGKGALTFKVDDSSITGGFSAGDVVDVTYTQLADGTLDASNVTYVELDTTGIVTSVGPGTVTVTDHSTGKPVTFTADLSSTLFDPVYVGDQIDVTYHLAASGSVVDRVLDATPGPSPQDVTGVVTAVSLSSVTLTDDVTGKPDTFAVDPIATLLAGVSVGDWVDVTFHIAPSGLPVVDHVLNTPQFSF